MIQAIVLALLSGVHPLGGQGFVTTVAGRPWVFPDGVPAVAAPLSDLSVAVTVDSEGVVYIADAGNSLVLRVDPGGERRVRIWAGGGTGGDGPARGASLFYPNAISVDSRRNIYVAGAEDSSRRIDVGGTIHRFTGAGPCPGFSPDGLLVSQTPVRYPSAPVFDSRGRAYFVEGCAGSQRVRRIENGRVTTVAGNGTPGFSPDGTLAVSASFSWNGDGVGLALDRADNLYISETNRHCIRRVNAVTGRLETYAGICGESAVGREPPAGTPARQARMNSPFGLAFDAAGNLYIADMERVRRVSPEGRLFLVAGNGQRGHSGDNGPAVEASIGVTRSLAVDPRNSDLYLGAGNRVRLVRHGIITTFAGNDDYKFGGDHGAATEAFLDRPRCLAYDRPRNLLYICDGGNGRIRVVDGSGVIRTAAMVSSVNQLVVDSAGTLFATTNNQIFLLRINPTNGEATPLLTGSSFFDGLRFGTPTALAVDAADNLYLAFDGNGPDQARHRVYRRSPSGLMTRIAGTGQSGSDGDGGLAVNARITAPTALAADGQGRVFLAESGRIRRVDPDGRIQAVTSAVFRRIASLTPDGEGNLFVSDEAEGAMDIRRVDLRSGVVVKVSGLRNYRYEGDGGPAAEASYCSPQGTALNNHGELLIADSCNDAIRAILPTRPGYGFDQQRLLFTAIHRDSNPAPQSLRVRAGPGAHPATVRVVGPSAPWLRVEPASSITPGNFTIRAETANLSAGTYEATLRVTVDHAVPAYRIVPVTLIVLRRAELLVRPVAGRSVLSSTIPRGNRTTALFAVINEGPDDAENVLLRSNLSANLVLLDTTIVGASCPNLLCTRIPVGASIQVQAEVAASVTAAIGAVLRAEQTAESEITETDRTNNTGTAAYTVLGGPSPEPPGVVYRLVRQASPGGSILSNPSAETFAPGTAVALEAIPAPGCWFVGWGGDVRASVNPAGVLMDRDRTAQANFECGAAPGESAGPVGFSFVPVAPCRILDTRDSGGGPLPAGGARTIAIAGSVCGIPAGARALSLNVTVAPQGSLPFLTIWPAGRTQPLASTLNAMQGQVVANAALVETGVDGAISAYAAGATHLILDINGYFR